VPQVLSSLMMAMGRSRATFAAMPVLERRPNGCSGILGAWPKKN
jgi:hypothetical protein